MRERDNLQGRLASEEDLVAATNRQIESAQRKIESLLQRIEDSKRQIKATEQLIEKLRADCETTGKRMDLLRQYMELVEAESEPTRPTVPPEEESRSQVADGEAGVENDEDLEDILYLEEDEDDDEDDLIYVEPPAEQAGEEEAELVPTMSFDDVDETVFVLEVLPRTHTFGEELLMVLAHHRKATAPKSVVRVFRRLDYAPKQPATDKNVSAQVESNSHFYEYTAGGRIALTREGRMEALRLLEEYY
jgi:hypothetical protein